MKNNNFDLRNRHFIKSPRAVSYLLPEEVQKLAEEACRSRNGERDYLFVLTLFQTGLRISEALSLTPAKIGQFEGKPVIDVIGKGNKPRLVSCPQGLAKRLSDYGRYKKLNSQERFFPFNRIRGWQIIKQAARKAGFEKKVFPHLLRHSDAIERLRQTGNPKALQHHLGHSSISMVMRYLSTLTQEESLRIQQKVEFDEKDGY
ncbi:MAG: tyrosine-type recombinase/integrase [Thermodesulfobacteriota bacterium]